MIKKIILLNIVLFISLLLFSGEDVIKKNTYFNLDFEDTGWKGRVNGWITAGRNYNIGKDTVEKYSGKSSLLMEGKKVGNDFAMARAGFPIAHARGKKIKFSGFIKTQDLTEGHAGLWWRVDGKSGNEFKILAFDNMEDRGPKGTTDWKKYVINLDVPVEGRSITFGSLMVGSGKAWFDNLQITLDGVPYKQVKPIPVVPTEKELTWIRSKAIPFKNADPTTSHKELMGLKKLIGNRHIVALGEGTHGTKEFFKMKHRLTRFLAEEMGFSIFAIEANMTEARKVNHYVLTGNGNPKEALAGLYFWTWNTAEVLEMIEWMRAYNQSGKGQIQFYGFDMQYPLVAADSVKDFVKEVDPGFLPTLAINYGQVKRSFDKLIKREGLHKAEIPQWHQAARNVYDHLKSHGAMYLETNNCTKVDWAIQNAHIVMQSAEPYLPNKRSRDQCMALNLDWILAHSPKGTKVVTWGHNGHVSRKTGKFNPMGAYLAKSHGNDMIVFGFAFHQGTYTAVGKNGINVYDTSPSEPGSIEWFLKSTGIPNMILDLSPASRGEKGAQWLKQELNFRRLGALAMDYAFQKQDITKSFDALIYFEESNPSQCFSIKKKEEQKAETPGDNQ